jgi:hypothetical protein
VLGEVGDQASTLVVGGFRDIVGGRMDRQHVTP